MNTTQFTALWVSLAAGCALAGVFLARRARRRWTYRTAAVATLAAVVVFGAAAGSSLGGEPGGAAGPGDSGPFAVPADWFGTFDGREMTVDDARALAAKGKSLVFKDFAGYNGINVSSALNRAHMVYGVGGAFRMVVRVEPDGKLGGARIESVWEDADSGVDIRGGGLGEFLDRYPVSMRVTGEATPAGAAVTLRNHTDRGFVYGNPYSIQRKSDGGWDDVKPINDPIFTTVGLLLPGHGSRSESVDWTWLYGELPPGDYRLVKSVSLDKNIDFTLFAAFQIG